MQPEDKYSHVFAHLNLDPLLCSLNKTSGRGRPERLNFRAMIYSLLIAKMERIEFVKDIVRRLRSSEEFRMQCRFTGADRTPSEASYSRLIKQLAQHGLLEKVREDLTLHAIAEGFLQGTHVAVDSSPVEAWDCQFAESASKRRAHRKKQKKVQPTTEQLALACRTPEPQPPVQEKTVYRRGRPSAEETERRKKEREAHEATLGPYETSVAGMLAYTYNELLEKLPRQPSLCAKKNSKGRITTWYGYKASLIVDTDSQYILNGVLSAAHLNDQRMAVLLIKGLQHRFPALPLKHLLGDKGYDSTAVYKLVRSLGSYPIIDFIQHTKPPQGYDDSFRPICREGHSYRYDSFDARYATLKYTRPTACSACPFANEGCQKVFKIKLDQDPRKYTYPARGSEHFKELYKKRTAVERVFAYLKSYFGLHRTRHRGIRANVDFQLSTLAFNLSKFALDKMNKQLANASPAA